MPRSLTRDNARTVEMNPVSSLESQIQQLLGRINYERQPQSCRDEFKLSNMIRLMELLGNPHLSCPVIHVAGTKGKGSVSAFIGAILTDSNYRTGVYSSPHLERINQRISVDGKPINDADLVAVLRSINLEIDTIDRMANQQGANTLTFFEIITAAAFQHFSAVKADAAVMEVGLGGRLDSTNVCQADLSIITSISLDHTQQLGNTVEKIAAEKAGIIKPRTPVICSVLADGPRQVIHEIAAKRSAPLFQLGTDFGVEQKAGRFDFWMKFPDTETTMSQLSVGMSGAHQQLNAATAIAACQWLRRNDWQIPTKSIEKGIATTALPGRCEIASTNPLVIFDIAHNAASCSALAQTLASDELQFCRTARKYLIFAASREKPVDSMLRPLLPLFDEVFITEYQQNPRFMPAMEILGIAESLSEHDRMRVKMAVERDPKQALKCVQQRMNPADSVCVTGSAFLVAELRPLLPKKL